MEDSKNLISRRKAFEYFVALWECIGTIMDRDEWEDVCMTTANEIPSAQPEHLREVTKKVDVISRQVAIDALAENMPSAYTPDGSHPADEGIFMAQEIYADCIQTLKELPSAQSEQRWIPVTERLPETNGQYLVTRWNGFSPKEMIIDIARYANGEWHKAYPIEAYMPLPEPYRKEGEA